MEREKVTFRENARNLERAKELWEDGPFENKSEFYRFATGFTLDQLLEDHVPRTDSYQDLLEEMTVYEGEKDTLSAEMEYLQDFRLAVDEVDRYGKRGDTTAIDEVVDAFEESHGYEPLLENFAQHYRQKHQPRPI
ncbi:MAG: hypothetical protein ABEJ64_03065 [Candidatus Nanohaloarchaea archaeon]